MTRMVIGLGNPMRGDDAVGLEVARQVRNHTTHVKPGASLDLLELWSDLDEVVVVDAMRSGREPGEVMRFTPLDEPLTDQLMFTSTHGFGLLSAIEMGRVLHRLPRELVVYGVEVEDVSHGEQMTPAVAAAARRLAREIDDA